MIIFTDIDGVLQTNNIKKWNKKCCKLFNDACKEFNLEPVITSTWRINFSIDELQNIFTNQGIDVKIFGYTDVLNDDRGLEIKKYIEDNNIESYLVIDDNVEHIRPYVKNVVAVEKSYVGMTKENYDEIEKIFRLHG